MDYKIYVHVNKINGKVYVGQTALDDINRRFKGGYGYISSPHFYNAIQEYGWNNFEHIVLETGLTAQEADVRERFWIAAFKATDPNCGYNLTSGGKTKPTNCVPKNKKKVICKETGQMFDSLTEAAIWGGMKKTSTSNIVAQIEGKRFSAGKHPETGEPLHWCYSEEEINVASREKKISGAKKVKNIDTGEIFNSVNEAARCYKIANVTISKSCKSNGEIPVGANKGPKYRWIFLN